MLDVTHLRLTSTFAACQAMMERLVPRHSYFQAGTKRLVRWRDRYKTENDAFAVLVRLKSLFSWHATTGVSTNPIAFGPHE